jgi:hypothetical protein
MALHQIILRLARNPGFPEGDTQQGYTVIAPLDADDRLDPVEWRQCRDVCKVVRFKPGDDRDADGRLTHNGSSWFFHYDEAREGADEPIYRLGDHRLAIGDYVTIHESDGQSLTYRVTERTPFRVRDTAAAHTHGAAR